MKYSYILVAFAATVFAVPADSMFPVGILWEAFLANNFPAQAVVVATDGQPAAAAGAAPAPAQPAVAQAADGQTQAKAAPAPAPAQPAPQKEDGQVTVQSAPAPAPVAQIPDGQVQATPAPAPAPAQPAAKQAADGQVQVASQIGDGQIQVPAGPTASAAPAPTTNGTITTPTPAPFEGAGSLVSCNKGLAVAVLGAAAGFALL